MSRMGRATSRFRLMLCESCASGEDWGDIHIDTEVLNEIAPLAQDRRARKSHHLPIMAGLIGQGRNKLGTTPLPPLFKNFAPIRYHPPENSEAASFGITANSQSCVAHTQVHITPAVQ